MVLARNEAVFQGADLHRVSHQDPRITQPLCDRRTEIGIGNRVGCVHEVLDRHITASHVDDLILRQSQCPSRLCWTTVASVCVKCGQRLRNPFRLWHVLAPGRRLKVVQKAGPPMAIQQNVDDGDLGQRVARGLSQFLHACREGLPRQP